MTSRRDSTADKSGFVKLLIIFCSPLLFSKRERNQAWRSRAGGRLERKAAKEADRQRMRSPLPTDKESTDWPTARVKKPEAHCPAPSAKSGNLSFERVSSVKPQFRQTKRSWNTKMDAASWHSFLGKRTLISAPNL